MPYNCSGALNTDLLKVENAPGNLAERVRGYVQDDEEPVPAVRYLNGLAANLAAAELHNLLCAFKPVRPYQRLDLMAERDVMDALLQDELDDFFRYLLDEGILVEHDEALRGELVRVCTIPGDGGGQRRIREDITEVDLERLADRFAHLPISRCG